MSVFRPKYKDSTGKLVESQTWWYKFTYVGRMYRESAKTTRKTIARDAEKRRRLDLERAYAGLPAELASTRVSTVLESTKAYRKGYEQGHREKSRAWVAERLAKVETSLGSLILPDLTETRIREYMKQRAADGAGPRTINMEISILARAIGTTWAARWPKVKRNEEPKDTGQALSPDQEARLLEAAAAARSPVILTFVKMLLLTGMRSGEVSKMAWRQVDFDAQVVTVGKAKTSRGTGRQIPMNQDLLGVMRDHAAWFIERFGETRPEYYLFPAGAGWPTDPTQPTQSFKSAWNNLRKTTGLRCRIHDLRHTTCTKLAEGGVPESTMLSIMGHMSRAMLERYSHIRMAAKRTAVECLSLSPKTKEPDGEGKESGKVNANPDTK